MTFYYDKFITFGLLCFAFFFILSHFFHYLFPLSTFTTFTGWRYIFWQGRWSSAMGHILAPYQIIILLRTSIDLMKESFFTLKKVRSRRYSAQTITVVHYADDIALLAITPSQVESQLLSLEQAAGDISLYVNANKTEYKVVRSTNKMLVFWNKWTNLPTSEAASHLRKMTSIRD